MPNKKRKLQDKHHEPPKKKPRYNINFPNDDIAPKCPNPYTPPKQTYTIKRTNTPTTATVTFQEYDNTINATSNNSNTNNNQNKANSNKRKSNHTNAHSQNYRKSVPSLRTSQDSLTPYTPINTPHMQTAQTSDATDVRIKLEKAAKRGKYRQKLHTKPVHKNTNANTQITIYWCLFILIGSCIGFSMCSGYIYIMHSHTHKKALDKYVYVPYDGSCLCDVTTNKTCIECEGCMDKYWDMYDQHKHCIKDKHELYSESETMKHEINILNNDINALKKEISYHNNINSKVGNECDTIENEWSECKKRNGILKEEIIQIRSNINCMDEIDKIRELEHEIGECNVEWGSCEQLGRQKNVLDKKRVEEFERQKQRFELCNQQLKRYKDAAKKNKGK